MSGLLCAERRIIKKGTGTPSLASELVRLGKLPRFLLPHFVRVLGVSSRHGHVWRKVTGTSKYLHHTSGHRHRARVNHCPCQDFSLLLTVRFISSALHSDADNPAHVPSTLPVIINLSCSFALWNLPQQAVSLQDGQLPDGEYVPAMYILVYADSDTITHLGTSVHLKSRAYIPSSTQ